MITKTVSVKIMRFILVLLLGFGAFSLKAQDPNFHIYLAFGQSNMEGQGTIENQDRTVDARFQNMQAVNCTGQTQGQWRTATPPIARCNTGLGPSDYFGREMIANLPENIQVGIVHVSVAGCKIELFDKQGYATYAAGVESWMQNIINAYGGNPYARLVELAKIAQQDGVIKGILLHQGESNTGDQQWPNKVKKVYEDLLTDLSLNANEVPLLAGQMVDAQQGGICASMNSIINTLPNTIPTAHVVSSAGCTDQSDNLHFNSAGYRLLGQRYAETMLSLLDLGGLSVRFTAPTNDASVVAGDVITLSAEASTDEGSIASVAFYEGDELIVTDQAAPYEADWSMNEPGSYTLRAVVTDNSGNTSETSVVVNVNVLQGPYGGTAHPIPGTIQAEEFDTGGNGFAYFDDTPGSEITSVVNFRTDEDVDIENCTDDGGGYNLGYTMAEEWLEYTVNVEASGTYDLDLRVACDGAGRTISVNMGDDVIADNVTIPNTAGWQTWQTVNLNDVVLKAGEQIMRITIGAENYVNLNYVLFTAINVSEPPVVEFTSPENISSFLPGQLITFQVDASDPDGTVASVSFYQGETLLGTDDTAPYSLEWSVNTPGTKTVTAIATDDKGITSEPVNLIIIIEATSAPFNDVPYAVPGRIEAEHYDLGGEGLGFHEENEDGNEGDADYRGDEVDVEVTQDTEGDYNIGYVLNGEWLAYTVNVAQDGNYDLDLRVAVDGDNRSMHLEIDEQNVSGPIAIPNTTGYQVWETVTVEDIPLTAGEQQIRLVFDANYMNLNYMEFKNELITSVFEEETAQLSVYPNPFGTEGFSVEVTEEVSYVLFNLLGTQQEAGVIAPGKVIGKNLLPGTYLLSVQNANGVKLQTLVVKQ